MGRALKWLAIGLIVIVAVMSFFVIRTLVRAGEWTTLRAMFDGACEPLEGFVGAEDMVRDPETGIVYAAGENRRDLRAGLESRGAVWALPMEAPETAALEDLTGGVPADFHPLGVDLHIAADGTRRLFVVNRAHAGHRVEIFRVEADGALAHERTLADPALANANDVVALGPDRAFVSIDKNAPTGSLAAVLEGALQQRTGRVVLAGPDGVAPAAEGLRYANGMVLSADGGLLFVVETVGRAVAVFTRDPATDELAFSHRIFLGTGGDNITRDADGRLFIAAHPRLVTFAMRHARDPRQNAPSQVLVLEADDPAFQEGRGDQVFVSLGEDISGSSVAMVDIDARRMLIGSVYEPHILSCTLPEVWRQSESHPARRPQTEDAH